MAKEIALVGRHRLYVDADPTTAAASTMTEVGGLRTINPASVQNMVNTRHAGANSEYQSVQNLARGINITVTFQVLYDTGAGSGSEDELDPGQKILYLASFGIRTEEVTTATDPSNHIAVLWDAPGSAASVAGRFAVSGFQTAQGGGSIESEATASVTLMSVGQYTVTTV